MAPAREGQMSEKWIRVGAGVLATIIAVYVGLVATGSFDLTPDPDTGLVAGANYFMLILALGLLIGFVIYAIVEYAQTRRLDSITSQFDTRTIVLMAIAIALVAALVALGIQLFRKRDLGVAYIVVGGAICGVISALISAPISAF